MARRLRENLQKLETAVRSGKVLFDPERGIVWGAKVLAGIVKAAMAGRCCVCNAYLPSHQNVLVVGRKFKARLKACIGSHPTKTVEYLYDRERQAIKNTLRARSEWHASMIDKRRMPGSLEKPIRTSRC